jgi:hypothetical protein
LWWHSYGVEYIRRVEGKREKSRIFVFWPLIVVAYCIPGLLDCHGAIVHLVEDGTREHCHGDEGSGVRVGRGCGVGREVDFYPEYGFAGGIEDGEGFTAVG